MIDAVKDGHKEKVRENYTELEQARTTVAEAEAHTEMVKIEECDKVTERKQHENSINATN